MLRVVVLSSHHTNGRCKVALSVRDEWFRALKAGQSSVPLIGDDVSVRFGLIGEDNLCLSATVTPDRAKLSATEATIVDLELLCSAASASDSPRRARLTVCTDHPRVLGAATALFDLSESAAKTESKADAKLAQSSAGASVSVTLEADTQHFMYIPDVRMEQLRPADSKSDASAASDSASKRASSAETPPPAPLLIQQEWLRDDHSVADIGSRVWDGAVLLYRALLPLADGVLQGKRVCEVGSGTGFLGLCCRLLGAREVFVTDLQEVVPVMQRNVELNERVCGKGGVVATRLAWGSQEDAKAVKPPFDTIVAADVAYELAALQALLRTLFDLSSGSTRILLACKKRSGFSEFMELVPSLFELRLLQANLADAVGSAPASSGDGGAGRGTASGSGAASSGASESKQSSVGSAKPTGPFGSYATAAAAVPLYELRLREGARFSDLDTAIQAQKAKERERSKWFAAEDVEFAGKVSGVGGLFARDSDSDSDSD